MVPLGFGGEDNPDKVEATVKNGDAIVVPAGVGHRLLEDLEGKFEMVGSYPEGKNWDMCYGKRDDEKKVEEISKLAWFEKDPIYGGMGPAVET
jgi:uncharacterized protein YjlB